MYNIFNILISTHFKQKSSQNLNSFKLFMKHTVQNYDGKYLDLFFLKLSIIIINYDFTPVVALLGQPV